MLAHLRPAFTMIILFSALTGLAYPLVTGIAQLLLPGKANGSLIERDGTVDAPYNAANSAGSNLGPTSKKLVERVGSTIATELEAGYSDAFVADAVTASASGLDPNISPQFALTQVPAVAKARSLEEGRVQALVEARTDPRFGGLIGEPRVNVLLLNLALDELR